MSPVHQLYCTHCSYGSSALKRARGALVNEVLGYSARAASLTGEALRKVFNLVEPYLYYDLPADLSSDDESSEAQRATDVLASPKRLFLDRARADVQIVGQVNYREADTVGREGSYFAHLLIMQNPSPDHRWSELDCLRLWGSRRWCVADSPSIPFDIPQLASLAEFCLPEQGFVNDPLLWSFLNLPSEGSFADPGEVIPPRWRRMTPQQRRGRFLHVFSGTLAVLDDSSKPRLFVLAEPSVAALLFYGVFRLLPSDAGRKECSFSTYEWKPDRTRCRLAAVPLTDRDNFPEIRRTCESKGLVIDTFAPCSSDRDMPSSRYANMIVDKLLTYGWDEIKDTLQDLTSSRVFRPSQWEDMASLNQVADDIFDPDRSGQSQIDRDWGKRLDYLGRVVYRTLKRYPYPETQLRFLLGKPNHTVVLELMCARPALEEPVSSAIRFLLDNLPEEELLNLLRQKKIGRKHRLHALTTFVARQHRLPGKTDWLWGDEESDSTCSRRSVLASALSAVPENARKEVIESIPGERLAEFVDSRSVDRAWKIDALLAHARRHKALPLGCEHLWSLEKQRGATEEPLILETIGRLSLSEAAAFLASAPDAAFSKIIGPGCLAFNIRVLALCTYMHTRERLPPFDELLWDLDEERKRPYWNLPMLDALLRVRPGRLVDWHHKAQRRCQMRMLRFLQAAARIREPCELKGTPFADTDRSTPMSAFQTIISNMEHESIVALFLEYGDDFFAFHPNKEKGSHLATKLSGILRELHNPSKDFHARVGCVRAARALFSEDDLNRLGRLNACLGDIEALSGCESRNEPQYFRWKQAAQSLPSTYLKLIPESRGRPSGEMYMKHLCRLAETYLDKPFLLDIEGNPNVKKVRERLAYALGHGGLWAEVEELRFWRTFVRPSKWSISGVRVILRWTIIVLCLVSLCLLGYFAIMRGH